MAIWKLRSATQTGYTGFSSDNWNVASFIVESSLLRLAIAEGLIRWKDFDAVAEHLPAGGEGKGVKPPHGRLVAALVAAGLLTEGDVERGRNKLPSGRWTNGWHLALGVRLARSMEASVA
jgi:hypothetical protein